jgi:hypothetical protein
VVLPRAVQDARPIGRVHHAFQHRDAVKIRQAGDVGLDIIARLRAPVALLDNERRLMFRNDRAAHLLSTHAGVFERDGAMYCTRRGDDTLLCETLRDLQLAPDSQLHTQSRDTSILFLSDADGQRSMGLHFAAIRPQFTLGAFGARPLAMVIFHEFGSTVDLDPLFLASTYDLTPAEASVAIALVKGLSAEEIAVERGVTVNAEVKLDHPFPSSPK